MIGHSVERATGDEAMEAVYGHAHLSHQIKKVATDTPYTQPLQNNIHHAIKC